MELDHVDSIDDTLVQHQLIGLNYVKLHGFMPRVTLIFMVGTEERLVSGIGTDFASALKKALKEKRLSLLNGTHEPTSEEA